MKWLITLAFGCCLTLAVNADAQETPASNFTSPNQPQQYQPNPENNTVLEEISSAAGQAAIENITNAEQIFCYQITNRPENYTGYTIDGMAIVGFCGVINNELKNMITSELFMNPENILFDVTEECIIRPKIMLRFVRGIDATDVLLSSPCHAFAIFYGGRVNAFNAKPAAPMLPIGVAQTDEQKALLNKKNEPIRNWVKTQQEEEASSKKSGWNNLNLKL